MAEVDSSSVVSSLYSQFPILGDAKFIFLDIKALLSKAGSYKCLSIAKSRNVLAHNLASLAFSSERERESFWLDCSPSCCFV